MVNEEEHKQLRATLKKVVSSYREQSLLSTALLFWVIALIVEVTLRIYDLYRTAPEVDLLSHLFAGIAMAASFFWLSDKFRFPHYRLAAIVGTVIVSLLWELVEGLQDLLVYNPPHLLDFFFWDGFFDVIIATVGAILFILIRKNIEQKDGFRC